jgi:hypothetical protein
MCEYSYTDVLTAAGAHDNYMQCEHVRAYTPAHFEYNELMTNTMGTVWSTTKNKHISTTLLSGLL